MIMESFTSIPASDNDAVTQPNCATAAWSPDCGSFRFNSDVARIYTISFKIIMDGGMIHY